MLRTNDREKKTLLINVPGSTVAGVEDLRFLIIGGLMASLRLFWIQWSEHGDTKMFELQKSRLQRYLCGARAV